MAGEYKTKLVNYFKKNLAKGYTLDSLKFALLSQGYARAIVESAIIEANLELAQKAPLLEEKPTIKYDIIDEYGKPIEMHKSWWKRLLGI